MMRARHAISIIVLLLPVLHPVWAYRVWGADRGGWADPGWTFVVDPTPSSDLNGLIAAYGEDLSRTLFIDSKGFEQYAWKDPGLGKGFQNHDEPEPEWMRNGLAVLSRSGMGDGGTDAGVLSLYDPGDTRTPGSGYRYRSSERIALRWLFDMKPRDGITLGARFRFLSAEKLALAARDGISQSARLPMLPDNHGKGRADRKEYECTPDYGSLFMAHIRDFGTLGFGVELNGDDPGEPNFGITIRPAITLTRGRAVALEVIQQYRSIGTVYENKAYADLDGPMDAFHSVYITVERNSGAGAHVVKLYLDGGSSPALTLSDHSLGHPLQHWWRPTEKIWPWNTDRSWLVLGLYNSPGAGLLDVDYVGVKDAPITPQANIAMSALDFNASGRVDTDDYILLYDAISAKADLPSDPAFDLNRDGRVDNTDLFLFAEAYGDNGRL